MGKTFINKRSVVHKGDGQTQICTLPDVCKTPSPGGPIPVPYVNIAQDSALESGSKSVSIEGDPVAIAVSKLSVSSGDEPGTAGGGLISSKIKGKLSWASYSLDVKFEGKGVIRFLDATLHNGNRFNSSLATKGRTGTGYGDDPWGDKDFCPRCEMKKAEHRMEETRYAQGFAIQLSAMLARYKYGGLRLTFNRREKRMEYGGFMVGALVCKCNTKIYAAMSGEIHASFGPAVKQLAKKDKRWTECGPLDQPLISYRTTDSGIFRVSKLEDVPEAPKPGACAAPRLIQKALADGHIPAAMSEIWHSPPRVNVRPLGQTKTTQGYWHDGTWTEKTFGHGDSVPSCNTCKVHLTPMLCSVRVNEC